MKILLVMPRPGQIVDDEPEGLRPFLPPSSLLEVAGLTPPDVEVEIFDELARGQIEAERLDSADIVGVSGLSTSHFGALRVAKLARERGKSVVAGGMHVSGLYFEGDDKEFLDLCDAIVVGRLTRHLWAAVIEDLIQGRSRGVYRADESEPWEFALSRFELVKPDDYYFPSLRSSAGCPYGCEFCTVNLVCDKLRVKSYEVLKRELELVPEVRIPPGFRMPLVDCADSFGVDHQHTLEVVLPLYAAFGRHWFTEITIRNLMGIGNGREPLLGPMADAGCRYIYIGVESILKRACAKSLDRKSIEKAIKAAQKKGLIVMASIILDITDEETEESIKETVEWTIDQGLDLVQYSLTAVILGSALRQRMLKENRVISRNWEHYSGAWPTKKHPNLEPEELIDLLRYAYHRTYSASGIARRIFGHSNRPLNLFANSIIYQMAQRWWNKVGFDYWEETRNMI